MSISVVVPTHPARTANGMLTRAVGSVFSQTRPADALIVEQDLFRTGAGETRHRGLMKVTTDWVAFLDSDDEFKPEHLERMEAWALETEADYVYSWYEVVGSTDPFPERFGVAFNPEEPIQTTVVTLVRTELAKSIGFLEYNLPPAIYGGEDWFFTRKCIEQGARIVHLPEKTWYWYHHGDNSSGIAGQGDSK